MSRDISNSDDIIDSRDVIKRLDELETERQDILDAIAEYVDAEDSTDEDRERLVEHRADLVQWDEDNGDELNALRDLAKEGEDYASDWSYGETLIRASYWVDYCQELCEDIGDIPKDLPHYIVINWEETADNLKADYTTVTFDGVEYYIRSN